MRAFLVVNNGHVDVAVAETENLVVVEMMFRETESPAGAGIALAAAQ